MTLRADVKKKDSIKFLEKRVGCPGCLEVEKSGGLREQGRFFVTEAVNEM